VWVKTPTLTREKFLEIYDQGPDSTFKFVSSLLSAISSMQDQIDALVVEVDQLKERNKTLEARLNQDSHNSSLPPSSDKFTKRYPAPPGAKSKRSPGGQKGHHGSTLKQVKTPDVTVEHHVHECHNCGTSLTDVQSTTYHARQVVDLPAVSMIVTEHRAEVKTCPCCNKESHARFPTGVTHAVQYGPEIKAKAVYFMEHQMLSSNRTVEALKDLYECDIAEGSLFNWTVEAAVHIAPAYNAIKTHAITSDVLHMDETAVNRGENRKWLHVACTPEATYLAFHTGRGSEAMNDIGVIPEFKGRAVHDMYASYFTYTSFEHAVCNAHIIRELTLAFEEYNQVWAGALIQLLLKALRTVKSAVLKGNDSIDARTLSQYEERYMTLVKNGLEENPLATRGSPHTRGKVKQSKVRNLLDRLHKHREHVLAFLYDFSVPFTNNEAERDLRMVKVKLKIAGCFRSVTGLDIYCRLRSYLSTARKNGVGAFRALVDAFRGRPFMIQQRCVAE
jgi:transposase